MSNESEAQSGASEKAHDAADPSQPRLVETGPVGPELAPEPAEAEASAVIEHPLEPQPPLAAEPAAAEAAESLEPEFHEAPAEPVVEAAAHEAAPLEAAPEALAEAVPETPAFASPAPEAAAFAAADAGHDTAAEEPVETEKGAKDEIFEIAKTIFYALAIALVLRVLFFQPFTIPSASMEPNLYQGDYIIVSKWNYGYSKHSLPFSPPVGSGRLFDTAPKRGDIVVFKLPRDNKTDYIKRVIGLPGDQIQVTNNQLFINGKPVPNTVAGKITVQSAYGFSHDATVLDETLPGGVTHKMQDFGPNGELDNTAVYTVPAGHYFMMGDNRDDSIDSRVPQEYGVGFVPAENLVGKADVVLFSWYPGASLWKPWTWFTKVRFDRFFHALK